MGEKESDKSDTEESGRFHKAQVSSTPESDPRESSSGSDGDSDE